MVRAGSLVRPAPLEEVGKAWQRLMGLSDEQLKQGNMGVIFGGAILAEATLAAARDPGEAGGAAAELAERARAIDGRRRQFQEGPCASAAVASLISTPSPSRARGVGRGRQPGPARARATAPRA